LSLHNHTNRPKDLMDTTTDSAPETLRDAMVDNIKQAGHARTRAVEAAMRTVPRHEFVPEANVADAYADIAVITKRAADGSALSCASVPTVVAMMLDQLDVHSGHNILEIGAGTGYNAALLAELTGPNGRVTTVDIDDEVTAGARRGLDATDNHHVQVVTRDGAHGAPENGPYDRIIVTVGPKTRSTACGSTSPRPTPETCRIAADQQAVASRLCTPVIPVRTPTITDGTSIAYMTHRRLDGPERLSELGAIGHGPAAQLAERFSTQIAVWDRDRTHQPCIDAYPPGSSVTASTTGMGINKHDSRLVLTL
jgi:protein-L-isoaspartate(D-aspartate) O-methyltransferase